MFHTTRMRLLSLILLMSSSHAIGNGSGLPDIHGSHGSAYQLDKEYQLGQAWVRMMRSQAQLLDLPVVTSYLRDRLWQLAPHSELQDKRLELLIIDSKEVNAFAAPGGIIGIHGGMVLTALQEDQLLSVIAHEFAHLSQRHYAQQQSESDKRQPLVLAGIIGSLLLAGVSPDAGAAAFQGTLGASESARLSFSRQHELDADQVGMRTLAQAGIDPQAMPRMFSQLKNANRFAGDAVPEFLRTHPVTQARIADSTNRAMRYPRTDYKQSDSQEYLIARAETAVYFGTTNDLLNETRVDQNQAHFVKYLLALKSNPQQADMHWNALSGEWQDHRWVLLKRLEQLSNMEGSKSTYDDLFDELKALYPKDYAVQRTLARLLRETGQYIDSTKMYQQLTREFPNDTVLWYHLAELYGLQQNLEQLHRARIEFFTLRAEFDLALRQIEFARRDARSNKTQLGWLNQREQEVNALKKQMDDLFR